MRALFLLSIALLLALAPADARAQADELRRPAREFDDCNSAGWCPLMVAAPAGRFLMGSPEAEAGRGDDEGPQRLVDVAAFAIGKYEVTYAQWDACVADGGCDAYRPDDFRMGRANRPVAHVSWEDAQRYVAWLSRVTGRPYRLLTEAEWEYAARAGSGARYAWGDDPSREHANYGAEACCEGQAAGRDAWVGAAPVGRFPANAFGLHDMHGNVSEWVDACHAPGYAPPNAFAATADTASCSRRVNRGGSWFSSPASLRSAYRDWNVPTYRGISVGFRVARSLAPGE